MQWHFFSSEDKSLLRKTWTVLEPVKQEVACRMYEMIFNQCPETRRLFPRIKFSGGGTAKRSNEFVFQALRFMQVIEGGVEALDDLTKLDSILDNLGRRHGKLEVNGKFRGYYWSTFLECAIFNMRKALEDSKKFDADKVDEAVIQWRNLLRDIIRKIKVGYVADISKRMSQLSTDDPRRASIQTSTSDKSDSAYDDE